MFALRKLVGAAALVVLALGLVACGDSGSTAEDVSVDSGPMAVQQAAAATAAQPTAKVVTSIAMTINGRDVSMTGTGELDAAGQRYSQHYDATELFATLVGNPPPGATAPMTVVADGPTTYVQFPGFGAVSNGKPWMQFDASAGNKMGDLFGGTGGGAFTSDPSSFLRFLEGAGNASEVGTDDIDGTSTTHYQGTYTINDSFIQMSQDERDRVTKAFDRLGFPLEARDEPITFDAWVGADGLVRRLSTTFDMAKLVPSTAVTTPTPASSSPTTSQLGEMRVTVDYSDFGAPVDIQVPPADQVQDLSTLVPSTK